MPHDVTSADYKMLVYHQRGKKRCSAGKMNILSTGLANGGGRCTVELPLHVWQIEKVCLNILLGSTSGGRSTKDQLKKEKWQKWKEKTTPCPMLAAQDLI